MRDIGLKFRGNRLYFRGLGIRTTLATFQQLGKWWSPSADLNTVTKNMISRAGAARSARAPIHIWYFLQLAPSSIVNRSMASVRVCNKEIVIKLLNLFNVVLVVDVGTELVDVDC